MPSNVNAVAFDTRDHNFFIISFTTSSPTRLLNFFCLQAVMHLQGKQIIEILFFYNKSNILIQKMAGEAKTGKKNHRCASYYL